MARKTDTDHAKTGTELEQERRKARLAAELRANLKRRKTGNATTKTPKANDSDEPTGAT